jgi:putative toxin-antitoxin system antitoxin component (TIGR02293 family)
MEGMSGGIKLKQMCCAFVAKMFHLGMKMDKKTKSYKKLDSSQSSAVNEVGISGYSYLRFNNASKLELIRKRLPYVAIEALVKRSGLSIKHFLKRFEMPQTTYNKKKREEALLGRRDSELVLVLAEVLDYGLEVFNFEEDKFQRWLQKPNISLGGVTPESLFDSVTGVEEVKSALDRIEYGAFA